MHVNDEPDKLTLNDHPPSDPRFTQLWQEVRDAQDAGVRVLAMLGGAAKGTYGPDRLGSDDDATFERFYLPLRDLLRERRFDGIDLDVEEDMSLAAVIRLIDRLRADFGPAPTAQGGGHGAGRGFDITLAPVATALLGTGLPKHNLSGFDYEALEVMRGSEISWYNVQFYCGWGDCSSPLVYEAVIAHGWPRDRIVVGTVTNPENGAGWVPWALLVKVLAGMRERAARRKPGTGGDGEEDGFAGVMGWEFFNALPGGRPRPWLWAQWMTAVLRDGRSADEAGAVVRHEAVLAEAESGVIDDMTVEVTVDDAATGDAPLPDVFEYYSDGLDGEEDEASS